jgi:inorganic triphosphatase YgiF
MPPNFMISVSRTAMPPNFMMGQEVELKFAVANQDLRKLQIAPAPRRKPPKTENLLSVYFDTPKHDLAENNITLRVRKNGNKRFQTVKSAAFWT